MTELLQERQFPEIPDNIFGLIKDITDGNDQINAETKWVAKQYLNGRFKGLDDENIDVPSELITGYNMYKHKLKPIMDYKSPEDLEDDITKIVDSNYKSREDFNKMARKGAKKIYDDDMYYIYKIENWAACKKYGAGTTWCITTRLSDKSFEHYKKESKNQIYFIINKKTKYKFAVVGDCVYDYGDSLVFAIERENGITVEETDYTEFSYILEENPNLRELLINYCFPTFDKSLILKSFEKFDKLIAKFDK